MSGDSGAPVFIWDGAHGATLVGVLSAGGSSYFTFSPMAYVEYDLGALTVHN